MSWIKQYPEVLKFIMALGYPENLDCPESLLLFQPQPYYQSVEH